MVVIVVHLFLSLLYISGIFMFSRLNEISDWRTDYKSLRNGKMEDEKNVEAYVVQRYLLHPLLIGMMRMVI